MFHLSYISILKSLGNISSLKYIFSSVLAPNANSTCWKMLFNNMVQCDVCT